jgi:hypothetical protein
MRLFFLISGMIIFVIGGMLQIMPLGIAGILLELMAVLIVSTPKSGSPLFQYRAYPGNQADEQGMQEQAFSVTPDISIFSSQPANMMHRKASYRDKHFPHRRIRRACLHYSSRERKALNSK